MIHWFVFYKNQILIKSLGDGTFTIPTSECPPVELKEWNTIHRITPLLDDGMEIRTVMVDEAPKAEECELCDLRSSYYKLPIDLYMKAGKCQEILYWDMNTRYCGVCGAPMKMHTDISKRCTCCGKEVWPQLATAIIVLVHRVNEGREEVLLVHARNFRSDFYGLVAGFVETGETLEEAVHREVKEETGLSITNLRYFGSQPWPYPCGLMVGFHADYLSGEVHLQKEELSKGDWFDKNHLPQIPEKLSIARKLIDDWLGSFK